MKKVAVVLAGAASMAALCNLAAAQSNVTIYGILDVGVLHESGSATGSFNKLSSGMSHGSRLGFKGTEDLGNGLSALFLLESGFQIDTGAMGQGGLLFGRQAYVGLDGHFGTLTAGRQYTPQYVTTVLADPFTSGLAGDALNIFPNTGNSASRMDNSLKYITPGYKGLKGELVYGFGETAGDNTTGRQMGGALAYANGPLNMRLGYHYRNNDTVTTETSSARNTLLAATWDFGPAKAHFGYGVDKGVNSAPWRNTANPYGLAVAPAASTDSTDLLVGVTVPVGVHTFLASAIRKDDKNPANRDARQYAVGYRYAFSKRTDTYLSYAHISNKNGAGYTVGSSIEVGTGDTAFSAGIRHSF
jgi:predicted porin